jgi:endonuclease/exonuclease/phosphatase family metal-dependent hydrolase
MRSSVEGARNIMIHNVYCTGNLSPLSSKIKPPDELLPVDGYESNLHDSASLSYTSAQYVLLGDFNIHHPNLGGESVRPDQSSQLLLTHQELQSLSLLLLPETDTFEQQNAHSTIDLVYFLSSLSQSLTASCFRKDLHVGSDHNPI